MIFTAQSTVNFPRVLASVLRDNSRDMPKTMSERDDKEALRLRLLANIDARARTQGMSDRSLSLAAKGNPDVIRNIRKGSLPRADTLAAIASILGCTGDELQGALAIAGEQFGDPTLRNQDSTAANSSAMLLHKRSAPAMGPNDFPVLGTAVGGEDGFFDLNGQIRDYIERPQQLFNIAEAYAIYIEEESMVPRYMPGEVVYVHPGRPLTAGCFVIVQLRPKREGEPPRALIKQLLRRTPGKIFLGQLNPPRELQFDSRDIVSIHRVVWSGELR
ncbi:MAG: hypothetical protein O7C63_09315 [Alphaproteobacteria bacterium]|nr:hypothetical protein [Alphaproteobacteria bacterium]